MNEPSRIRTLQQTRRDDIRLDWQLAYAILRLTLGVNILLRGLPRRPHLGLFANGLVQAFAKTPLPPQVVRPFVLVLPLAETVVGLLLKLGLWTRFALVGGGLLIAALAFAWNQIP